MRVGCHGHGLGPRGSTTAPLGPLRVHTVVSGGVADGWWGRWCV